MLSRMRPRLVIGLGVASGIVLSHEPPHAHEPVPGELAPSIGKLVVNSNSTSSAVMVGTPWLDWSDFPPTVRVRPMLRVQVQGLPAAGSARLFGVPWTDAAVIAAILGGAFAIAKETLSFVFRLIEDGWQRRRLKHSLYARVWHDLFQMAVGAIKALRTWPYDELAAGGWAVPAPSVDFLRRYDAPLASDILQLLADSPETVTGYLHAVFQRDYAGSVAKAEEDEFGSIAYQYPRTRNVLRMLLENVVNALDELSSHLPAKHWWEKKKLRPREICETNAKQFRASLQEVPVITREDALRISIAARLQLDHLKRKKSPEKGGDAGTAAS